MEDEKDAFYVVRKGDIVGVYKNFSDFQPLLYGPNVAVFKGYRLPKPAEEYLASHGLNNAIYSVGASDVQGELFGQLVPCPFQKPSKALATQVLDCWPVCKTLKKNTLGKKSSEDTLAMTYANEQPPSVKDKAGTKNPADNRIKKKVGSTSFSEGPQRKLPEIESFMETLPCSCILEFDGAAKGNPGPAGAGAVLRAIDGSLVYRLREGLGVATNNAAEYRAVILGLRYALERGFRHIRVQGDSKLVCMQVNGLWKTKTQNMTSLCKVAKELKDKFASFQICHVEREFNTEADAQANLGIHLQIGEVQEEVERR
ncbi:hypothetical protein Ccrd_012470 [Cynara cardunculus var. scolymus]|uniref:RNase H type-1 domain-containing protein n=1 Tax=Cynara cardunculus var. scolymus TaxID=59895 RepID=A0A103YHC9_CYNCS|nr:hypothetical protein Ccrd_012470 [Cynara cardunculus var. scolymus]